MKKFAYYNNISKPAEDNPEDAQTVIGQAVKTAAADAVKTVTDEKSAAAKISKSRKETK